MRVSPLPLIAPGGILHESNQLGADLPAAKKDATRYKLQEWYLQKVYERRANPAGRRVPRKVGEPRVAAE